MSIQQLAILPIPIQCRPLIAGIRQRLTRSVPDRLLRFKSSGTETYLSQAAFTKSPMRHVPGRASLGSCLITCLASHCCHRCLQCRHVEFAARIFLKENPKSKQPFNMHFAERLPASAAFRSPKVRLPKCGAIARERSFGDRKTTSIKLPRTNGLTPKTTYFTLHLSRWAACRRWPCVYPKHRENVAQANQRLAPCR